MAVDLLRLCEWGVGAPPPRAEGREAVSVEEAEPAALPDPEVIRDMLLRLGSVTNDPPALAELPREPLSPEQSARSEAVDRALRAAIQTLDPPARWFVAAARSRHQAAIEVRLGEHIEETQRGFLPLTDAQRAAILAPFVEEVVSPYRGWLSTSALALGLIPPVAVGYLIGMAPATLAVLLSLVSQKLIGPASFQLDMKVNAWVKKLTYSNKEKRDEQRVETPYQLWAAKVVDRQNANIRDVPRDGVSIAKDALLFLNAHLAELPAKDAEAYDSFARAILLQVEAYPQAIELDEDEAQILRNRFHERFGSPEAYQEIRAILEQRAHAKKVNFEVAELLLAMVLGEPGSRAV